MKYIGIFTVIDVYNYGTKLQAYAMQEIFKNKGYVSEILTYEEKKGVKSKIKFLLKSIVSFFLPKYLLIKKHNAVLASNYKGVPNNIKELIRNRMWEFDGFDKYYNYKHFVFKRNLIKHTKKYSAVVCGSDQIWHPILNRNKFWTLQYVSKNVRRFSYAPSLGVNEIPEDAKPFFRKVLKTMNKISVREEKGAELLKELTDKPITVVLDPTLLAGRKVWDKILKNREDLTNNANYCLCYLLGPNEEHRRIVVEAANYLNLSIYNFSHFKQFNNSDEILPGKHLYDVSPEEFIGLISKAKFVITDSFHCSVFSLMYHIPFVTLLRYNDKDNLSTNSRIFSLLGQFGLETRIYTGQQTIKEIIDKRINYDYVDKELDIARKNSEVFLNDALTI